MASCVEPSASSCSRTAPVSSTQCTTVVAWIPDSASSPAMSSELVSGICPRDNAVPGSSNSAPVISTATLGAVRTGNMLAPAAARAERRAAVSCSPAWATGWPAALSSPRRRISLPGCTVTWICTVSASQPVTAAEVSSTRTTASALDGIGAPVMIFTHWPGSSFGSQPLPAGTSPMTSSATGAAAVSTERTA